MTSRMSNSWNLKMAANETEASLNADNVEVADKKQVDDTLKSCSTLSNQEVVDLFYCIFEDLREMETNGQLGDRERVEDRKQKLHGIVCTKLRFPEESELKGIFNAGSFRINVVESSVKSEVHRKCERNGITTACVLETNKDLKLRKVNYRLDQLIDILCKKSNVNSELIDTDIFDRKVKKIEKKLKTLKEKRQLKKIEGLMKSVFYLPVIRQDLMKDLQENPENMDYHFLQSENTDLTNGLAVDVFDALKGDLVQVRKVLRNRFTFIQTIKAKSFYDKVLQCVKQVENLKETSEAEKLDKFVHSLMFESNVTLKTNSKSHTKGGSLNNPVNDIESVSDSNCKEAKKDNNETGDKVEGKNEKASFRRKQPDVPFQPYIKTEKEDSIDYVGRSKRLCSTTYVKSSDIGGEKDSEDEAVDIFFGKRRRKAYDNAFKLIVLQYAEKVSNRAAARKFQVPEKSVRYWRNTKAVLQQAPKTKKKNVSVPKELELIEEDLKKWFLYYQKKGTTLTKKAVRVKAKTLAKEAKYNINTDKYVFGGSWCDRFFRSLSPEVDNKGQPSCGNVMNESSEEEILSESDSAETVEYSSFDEVDIEWLHAEDDDIEYKNTLEKQHSSDNKAGVQNETVIREEFILNEESTVMDSSEEKIGYLNLVKNESNQLPALEPDNVGNIKHAPKTAGVIGTSMDSVSMKRKRSSDNDTIGCKVRKCAHSSLQEDELSEVCSVKHCAFTSEKEYETITKPSELPAELEEELVTWIKDMQKNGSNITMQLVEYRARFLCNEERYNIDTLVVNFSYTWFCCLMKKHDIQGYRKKDRVKNDKRIRRCKKRVLELPPELLGVPNNKTADNKAKRRQSYDNAFKRNVISFAESSSNDLAVQAFNICEKNVRSWRKDKDKIFSGPTQAKRHVVRRKQNYSLEQDLDSWCQNLQTNYNKTFTKSTLRSKALQLAAEKDYGFDTSQFKASDSWVEKFLSRYGYVLDGKHLRMGNWKKKMQTTDVDDTTSIQKKSLNKSSRKAIEQDWVTSDESEKVEDSDESVGENLAVKSMNIKSERI